MLRILSIFFLVTLGVSAKLPDYLKICKRDQNTVNECILDSIEKTRPYLLKGIPELSLPSIDPYELKELKPMQEGLSVVLKNIRVLGAGAFKIEHLDVDIESKRVSGTITAPALYSEGSYAVDTQILAVPIKGAGKFAVNATDCEARVVLKYKVVNRDGQDYAEYVYCDLNLRVGDYHITVDGLDAGIGNVAEKLINENKREMLQFALPYIQGTVGQAIVLEAANRIASSATYDEFFPAS